MKAIYKYNLADMRTPVPKGEVLHVGEQELGLFAWILVDTYDLEKTEDLYVYGTGHSVDVNFHEHVGTAVMSDGFVWHVFKRRGR